MNRTENDLAEFQSALSEGRAGRVSPSISDNLFRTLALMEETTPTSLGRRCGVSKFSAGAYARGQNSPTLVKLSRMLDRLGYDLYIHKRKPR